KQIKDSMDKLNVIFENRVNIARMNLRLCAEIIFNIISPSLHKLDRDLTQNEMIFATEIFDIRVKLKSFVNNYIDTSRKIIEDSESKDKEKFLNWFNMERDRKDIVKDHQLSMRIFGHLRMIERF